MSLRGSETTEAILGSNTMVQIAFFSLIVKLGNCFCHLRIKSALFLMDLKFKSAHLICLELAMVRASNVTKQSHD
jgi:hypothetical protein